VVTNVFVVERGTLGVDTVGLRLSTRPRTCSPPSRKRWSKSKASLAAQVPCPDCGTPRRHKDGRDIVVRSLFGTLRLASPHWWHCSCCTHETQNLQPAGRDHSRASHPRASVPGGQARCAGLLRPVGQAPLRHPPPGTPAARHRRAPLHPGRGAATRRRARRRQAVFIDGCPAQWETAPPDLPLVSLDGGYIPSAHQRSRRDGWFEVIAGKTMPADGPAKLLGSVQTYDTKPKRRLFEALNRQGMRANQTVTFVTDGGDDVRDLTRYVNPTAEHLLDWFHITMRLTVMANMAKSLRPPPLDPNLAPTPPVHLAAEVGKQVGRLKWFLWHGNVFLTLQIAADLIFDLDIDDPDTSHSRRLRAVTEFDTYIRANISSIPNYRERYRAGEVISSSFVESAVNEVISKRMVKNQQMRWIPRGAHL
jgi:hypothetical protein